jgi:Domain of unknown function (DUF4190)
MYYLIGADQKEYGPVAADEVRAWIAECRANGQTLTRLEGGPWKPLSTFPEFAATLGAAPQPPPVPLAQASFTGRAPETNSMAVAGLVMGILSMTIGLVCCGLIFNILGIIFSSVALSQIKRSQQTGRNLAIVGLVLSLLGLVFEIIKIVVFGAMGLLKEIMQRH